MLVNQRCPAAPEPFAHMLDGTPNYPHQPMALPPAFESKLMVLFATNDPWSANVQLCKLCGALFVAEIDTTTKPPVPA